MPWKITCLPVGEGVAKATGVYSELRTETEIDGEGKEIAVERLKEIASYTGTVDVADPLTHDAFIVGCLDELRAVNRQSTKMATLMTKLLEVLDRKTRA